MHHPGRRIVAEIRKSHRGRGVYTGQKPEEYDGEETADAKEDQNASWMHNSSNEKEETKEGEESL